MDKKPDWTRLALVAAALGGAALFWARARRTDADVDAHTAARLKARP